MKLKLNEAIDLYLKTVKNCDVVNISNHSLNPITQIGCFGIRQAQKGQFKNTIQLFGGAIESDPNEDTHSMMHFDKELLVKAIIDNPIISEEDKNKVKKIWQKQQWAKVFSVEPPRATYIPIEDFIDNEITVYRYVKENLTEEDYKIMAIASLPVIGTKYDYFQLINILINQELGYPFTEKVKWFNWNKKNMVCSVGVGYNFQKRKYVLEEKGIKVPRLFSKLNPINWDDEFIKRFERNKNIWNIENYYPTMFGLTASHFDNEFMPILKLKKLELLYKL